MAAETNLTPAPQIDSKNFWLSLGMSFPEQQNVTRTTAPVLHTHDGQGRRIEGGPMTTAEACRAGVALYE